MTKNSDKYKQVASKLKEYGQLHLLQHLEGLPADDASKFLNHLDDIDCNIVKSMSCLELSVH